MDQHGVTNQQFFLNSKYKTESNLHNNAKSFLNSPDKQRGNELKNTQPKRSAFKSEFLYNANNSQMHSPFTSGNYTSKYVPETQTETQHQKFKFHSEEAKHSTAQDNNKHNSSQQKHHDTEEHEQHSEESLIEEEENEYNPLKIPPDWKLAEAHAKARQVATEKKQKDENIEVCQCCGYEVERDPIPYFANPMKLNFLGSGFPLFYNFIVYCIFILFQLFSIKGGYNLVTNIMGDYCATSQKCPNHWQHIVSLANKLNKPDLLEIQEYLGLINAVCVMITLLFFRASQRRIDVEIDISICSPADYTIIVKNIPKNLNVNYKKEITKLFKEFGEKHNLKDIDVRKVVLVHDIEEIVQLEEDLDKTVKKKQNHLLENFYRFDDPALKAYDKQIEEIEEEIHKIEHELQKNNEKFTGIAFVAFQTEKMKQEMIKANPWTAWERIQSYFNNNKLPNISEDVLQWNEQKLFVEQAPEPNDIDWEFIHCKTKDKIYGRIKSYTLSLLFMIACFLLTYAISMWLDKQTDEVEEQEKEGKVSSSAIIKMNVLSFVVSWTIVLLNKFVIGKVLHYIVDYEKISNKTKFNTSYAQKLSVALFMNTAVISYIIDILLLGNIIGQGGFIQNETQVFILNALFPPIVWIVDPWSIHKNYLRNKEKQEKGNQCILTQAEANFLEEQPDYLQSKRYADIMKTMWFTFLYGSAIPIGIAFSMLGLTIYYYADKYNVLRRRTIKENLSKDLSIEMIEMLELIIIFNGVGNFTMSYLLLGQAHWQDITMLVISVIYCTLDMQAFSEKIFPIDDIDEDAQYSDAELLFDTDYDRENPVTKNAAKKRLNKLKKKSHKKPTQKEEMKSSLPDHQQHHQVNYDEQNEGYEGLFGHRR